MGQSLFTRLDAEWSEFYRRPESVDRFQGWKDEEPILRPFGDLDQLIRFARTPDHPADSDDLLRCLARRSSSDAIAARTLLQAVLYALVPIAVRFRTRRDESEEIAAVVVAAAYDRIRTYPIARRPRRIAANIVLDTRQAVSRNVCRPRVVEHVMADIERVPIAAATVSAVDEVIELVAEAVRKDRLCRADAQLIVLTRVFDVSVDDLAAEHGCLPHSLRRRRLRAEAALARAVA